MFHDDPMHIDMPIATVDQHTPVKQSVDLLDEPEFLLQQMAACMACKRSGVQVPYPPILNQITTMTYVKQIVW